ncbi:hypothetical protein [Streptomyces sp. NPDC005438]|uniref:hypothetical protein n=1 Tax=Streptomyces sp. NPDC005438 TaxID=3156880 RepID=UPI0033B1FDF8
MAAALVVFAAGVTAAAYVMRDDDSSRAGNSAEDRAGVDDSSPASPDSVEESEEGQPVPNPTPVDYKGINLADDYHLNFASDPVEPAEDDRDSSNPDLGYSNSFGDKSLTTSEGKMVLLNNAQKGSLDTCRSETRFTTAIDFERISKGSQICVRTYSGHLALVTVKGFAPRSDPSDYVSLDVRVWRNALEAQESDDDGW